ncbi:MAG: VTT domain-containing protein [Gemmataceae bacterium]|nr:VTT domain-containing protein [Gemmataceae bacterium]MDW8243280.1 VTT domain-containing protein [Thermogemmata sp.]
MEDILTQVGTILWQVLSNLTNPDAWREALAAPGVVAAAFIVLNLIVFTETGLLIGFFLPGDSLLVTAGIVAHSVGWPVHWLIATLCVSAILGDTVGYWLGHTVGPPIFNKPGSRWFRRDHLLAAKAFYDSHGGKTIIIARFIPIIRTFAPVVAGAAPMEYRRFLTYNVVGGIGWIVSMVLLGYTLHIWLDPLLKPMLGEQFQIARHIDKVVVIVVLLSVLPLVLKWWQQRRRAAPAVASTQQ